MPSRASVHPLAKYLKREGLSLGEFASKSGIAKETLSRGLSGVRRRFSAEAAFAIERVTEGEVKFFDCWSPSLKHPPPRIAPARREAR